MPRRPSRSMLAVASAALVSVTLAACTSSGSGAGANSAAASAGASAGASAAGQAAPVTLTVFAPQNADQDLKTNAATKAVQDALGISFDWQTTTYDAAAASEKLKISLASGDFPDVYMLISWVTQFSQDDVQKYGSQGVLVPLNDLIDKYAPNVKKAFEESPQWKKMATAPDGKIYGLPQWNDCYHCSYPAKLWMNSAWLKKLNLTAPTTTEEFAKVLKAFKTGDPNGNGTADEIPLTSLANDSEGFLIPYLLNSFLYTPGPAKPTTTPLALNGGKVQFQAAQPAYRQGLEYIASLYKDGLIDKAAFTQNYDAMKAEGDNASAVLVGAAATMHTANIVTLGQKDGRDKQYDTIPPLTGPAGVSFAAYNMPSTPGAMFAITSKATPEEQVAAIKLLDYLVGTQGHLTVEFGPEGTAWVKPGASDKALDGSLTPLFKYLPAPAGSAPRNDAWGAIAQLYSPMSFRNAQVQPTDVYDPSGFERRLFDATKTYEAKSAKDAVFPAWSIWLDKSTSADVAELQTNLQNAVAQTQLKWITGQQPLDDASWNAYLGQLKSLGLDRYLELMQAAYDKSK